MSIINIKNLLAACSMSMLIIAGCNDPIEEFENPYSGGKAPLDLKFSNSSAIAPAEGWANDTVIVNVAGAEQYKEQLHFQFSGEEAEILSVTGDQVKVKVPLAGSSGATSVRIGDQIFFGPQFKVFGKVSDDPYFKGSIGTNSAIYDAYKFKNGNYIMVGAFTDFNNKGKVLPIRAIAEVSYEGEVQRTLQFGGGLGSGNITSVTGSDNDANIFIAGNISSFDTRSFMKNITRLSSNGTIDLKQVDTYRSIHIPGYPKRIVPAFNGGTDNPIRKIFYFNNGIIAVGGFKHYMSFRHDVGRSFPDPNVAGTTIHRDSLVIDSIPARQVVRFNLDGSLDKSYHFAEGVTLPGGNGSVLDAAMQADGKLVLVGAFSRFDNKPAGGIVRLNTDGTVDESFQAGKGATGYITSINWNGITKKFVLTGVFSSFDNRPLQNIVLLDENGAVDNSFSPGDFDNGYPTFAHQLSDGLIIVSGYFKKYNNVRRNGFMILSPTGTLAPGYNSLGEFSGNLFKVLEERNGDNKRSIVLLGSFRKFDSRTAQNIKGLVLED
jgi:hypothetical protein